MPVITDGDGRVFIQTIYDLESKPEADVVALADRIFRTVDDLRRCEEEDEGW
jgi:hypothetical protein